MKFDFRRASEDVSIFDSFRIKTLQNLSANMTSTISSRFFSVKEILVIQQIFALKCYLDTSVTVKLHETA